MSHSGDLSQRGEAYTLHRDIAEGVPAAAARYVLKRAVNAQDAAHLLEVLGLTDVAHRLQPGGKPVADIQVGDLWRKLTPKSSPPAIRRLVRVCANPDHQRVPVHPVMADGTGKGGEMSRLAIKTLLRDYELLRRAGQEVTEPPDGQCARCGEDTPGAVAARMDVCRDCDEQITADLDAAEQAKEARTA